LTRIIEKRLSLHKNLAAQRQQNTNLKLQLGQLQALANIGVTTCMIAHELNNLLTPLSNYASLALNNPGDKSLTSKALQITAKNCQRASKIMKAMLAMANGEAKQKESTRLITLVEDVFTALCRDFAKDGITVKIQIPEDLNVWAVPVEIQQVLMNLILNARSAMLPRGGILTIKAQDSADAVQIEVCDTGCGIESSDLEKIFEPFFTTKADKNLPAESSGSGLGLAFCKKVIDSHAGRILVESEPARGSTFKITLPKPQ
jgi:two-component system NtrC family sensor kinase